MKLNKKQKRTATIASMAALLAVVLGMGGSTFAKYITTHNVPAQTATVAKWGVVINSQASGTDTMFSNKYDGDDGDVISGVKSVAPGTSGSIVFNVNGTPEVKTSVAFSVVGEIKEVKLGDYTPIVWKLDGAPYDTIEALAAAFEGLDDTYDAGAGVSSEHTVSWEWKYYVDDATDVLDTKLGDLKAGITADEWKDKYNEDLPAAGTYCLDVAIDFMITATQVGE